MEVGRMREVGAAGAATYEIWCDGRQVGYATSWGAATAIATLMNSFDCHILFTGIVVWSEPN